MSDGVFECDVNGFMSALKRVACVVPQRTTRPVLRGVLLEAHEGGMAVTASNGRDYARVELEAGEARGRLLIGHRELTALLGAVVKGTRQNGRRGWKLRIRCGSATEAILELRGDAMTVEAFMPDAFPCVGGELTWVAGVARTELARAVDVVTRAARRNPAARKGFDVKLEVGSAQLTLVGTDSFRVAAWAIDAITGRVAAAGGGSLVDPELLRRAVGRMAKPVVGIAWGRDSVGDLVGLRCGDMVVGIGASSGEFEAPESLFDAPTRGSAVVDADLLGRAARVSRDIAEALDQVGSLVDLRFGEGCVWVVPSLRTRGGEARAPGIPAQVGTGLVGCSRRVRGEFLVDALESFAGERVAVHLTRDGLKLVFTKVDCTASDAGSNRHLVVGYERRQQMAAVG